METSLFTREENFSFWKNIFLIGVFFTIAPLTLGISLFSLYSLKTSEAVHKAEAEGTLFVSPNSGVRVYASLPEKKPTVTETFETGDARPEIVRQYLSRYKSPLEPQAGFIVSIADKYSIDFRLITAIAQQESNLCKIIPPGGYNCWGWGIHSQGTLGFQSFEEGIETVSKGLKEKYIDMGYLTPDEIMTKYTPQSNGSWARGVNQFMAEME
jgi:hypothetical protein